MALTKDLSRLGRNSSLVGLYTSMTFPKYGVRYIAINDNYDSDDPNSINNDFAGIKNWFNEFYARDTSRKIRAVQRAKGEKGAPLTTNVPYGYVKDPDDPFRWHSSSVVAILERREYTGCIVNFKTYTNSIWDKKQRDNPIENQAVFPDSHERIIEDDVFEKVQKIREQRHRKTKTGRTSMFSGLVFCSDCGECKANHCKSQNT